MSFIVSNLTVSQELSLIVTLVTAVGLYLYVSNTFARRKNTRTNDFLSSQADNPNKGLDWDDRQPLFWRQSLGKLGQHVDQYFISVFSVRLLSQRSIQQASVHIDTKMCVSRSAQDTEKLIMPLLKKIEARLRRAELRPRPRLTSDRSNLPFPLFSSMRPDIELSTYVLNFLDACIDLSASCDTQVNFTFDATSEGVYISAVWKKNQLIADATAQIELLDHMRLTMSGEQVRWDFRIFECINTLEQHSDTADLLSA